MRMSKPELNTPNKLAKAILADCLESAYYISDEMEIDKETGMVTGYVRGDKILSMTLDEYEELYRFLYRHKTRVEKFLGFR